MYRKTNSHLPKEVIWYVLLDNTVSHHNENGELLDLSVEKEYEDSWNVTSFVMSCTDMCITQRPGGVFTGVHNRSVPTPLLPDRILPNMP